MMTMTANQRNAYKTTKETMSQEWWQECAEELAAKVRGYFTAPGGTVEIDEKMNGDRDLYTLASRLTKRVVQPGGKTP
jgi:hypothetical protein